MKIEYLSVPFSRINSFSVESAGVFDLDAELKIWVSGLPGRTKEAKKKDCSIVTRFSTGVDVYAIQKILAERVCKGKGPGQ